MLKEIILSSLRLNKLVLWKKNPHCLTNGMSYEMSQRITQQSMILERSFNIRVVMNHHIVFILFEEYRLWHSSHRTKVYKENAFALLFLFEKLTAIPRARAPHLY